MNDNRSLEYVLKETIIMIILPALFGLFLLFSAGRAIAAASPNMLVKTYTYVIKYKQTGIGDHKASATVQDCGGGKVKVIKSNPDLINRADPYGYFWVTGNRSGWGAKGCSSAHFMRSEGFLNSPKAPNYHSIVLCEALPPEVFLCSHSIHVEGP